MAFVPPWLDVSPRDFVSAAERGTQAGISSRTETDDVAMRRAQLAQQGMAASQRASLEARGQDMEQQRAKVEGEIAKQKASLEWQDAAQKFAAQQRYQKTYQQLVAGGATPENAAMQAMLTVGPSSMGSGDTTTGIAQMMRTGQMMAAVPKPFDFGNGVRGVSMNGMAHMAPIPKPALAGSDFAPKGSLDDRMFNFYSKVLTSASADPADQVAARKWLADFQARGRAAASQPATPQPKATIPQGFIGSKGGQNQFDPTATGFTYGAPAAQPAQAPANGGSTPGLPQAGQIVSGYKFKGGDPADQNNWEQQ